MPRRVLAALVALATAALVVAAAPAKPTKPALATKLARALAVPHVRASQSGAVAFDLASGDTVFLRHPTLSLVPASNAKLAVAYASLHVLGPDFRIDTIVFGEGKLAGSTWNGDLVLKGFGDPTLSRGDLRALARQIRAYGIRQVTGGIEADESYFDSRRVGPAWRSHYYINESPPLSALTVDRARFRGYVTRRPAIAAGTQFRLALRAAGVGVRGRVVMGAADPVAMQLASTESAPLSRIVAFMNHESDNFTAELLLKQIGAVDGGAGTSAAGAESVRRSLGGSRRAAGRCAHRRRIRALAEKPAHGGRRHRDAGRRLERPHPAIALRPLARRRGRERDARRPVGAPAGPRCGTREDRDAPRVVGPFRLREGAVGLRSDPERPAPVPVLGPRGPRTGSPRF